MLYLVLSPEFDMTAFSCNLTFTYLFVLPVLHYICWFHFLWADCESMNASTAKTTQTIHYLKQNYSICIEKFQTQCSVFLVLFVCLCFCVCCRHGEIKFIKTSSSSGVLPSWPHPGLCPWTPLGALRSRARHGWWVCILFKIRNIGPAAFHIRLRT